MNVDAQCVDWHGLQAKHNKQDQSEAHAHIVLWEGAIELLAVQEFIYPAAKSFFPHWYISKPIKITTVIHLKTPGII